MAKVGARKYLSVQKLPVTLNTQFSGGLSSDAPRFLRARAPFFPPIAEGREISMIHDPRHGEVVPEEEAAANRLRRRNGSNPPPLPTPSPSSVVASAAAATTAPGTPPGPRAAAASDDDADYADAETDATISTLLLLSSFTGILGMRSLGARLLSLAFAACCALSLACALVHWRRQRRRRRRRGGASLLSPSSSSCSRRRRRLWRGALAVALRLGFAAACNAVVAGGRKFPTVSSLRRFFIFDEDRKKQIAGQKNRNSARLLFSPSLSQKTTGGRVLAQVLRRKDRPPPRGPPRPHGAPRLEARRRRARRGAGGALLRVAARGVRGPLGRLRRDRIILPEGAGIHRRGSGLERVAGFRGRRRGKRRRRRRQRRPRFRRSHARPCF